MKRYQYSFLLLFVFIISTGSIFFMESSIKSEVKDAFIKGKASLLSPFLNEMVNMCYECVEGTYSRSQAESILSDFFAKNPPKAFEINQEGITKDNSEFVIATYTAIYGCKYRIYYLIKKDNTFAKRERIYELKISKHKQCQSRK